MHRDQGIGGRRLRQAGDFHITETVISEMRFQRAFAKAVKKVILLRRRAPKIRDVDGSTRVDDFGMAQRDVGSCRAIHNQPAPTGDFLPEIIDIGSG